MRRAIYCLIIFIVCVSSFVGCSQNPPHPLPDNNQTVEDNTTYTVEDPVTTQAAEEITATQPTEEATATQPIEETAATQPTEETTATQATEETTSTQVTEEIAVTQPAEETTATQPTEETAVTQPTEETTATQPTEEIQDYVSCSTCHIWYEGMNLVDGQCESCRDGLCFLCNGPDGPNHDCNDYPNVICPSPDCDWGIYTTGVGIDGIICPKCGTRCI